MKKNKGFTLIELLTVIAILAIILLIAAPTILNVLDKAKKNTFKNQVLMYVEGLKQQVALQAINVSNNDVTITWASDGTGTVNITDLNKIMENGVLNAGVIKIKPRNKGQYTYELLGLTDQKTYCIGDNGVSVDSNSIITDGDNVNVFKYDATTCTVAQTSITYTAYSIGAEVTLKDGSKWRVIENSDSSNDTVTLFASKNFKSDGTGWSNQTTNYSEYRLEFDEANARTTENNSYCTSPRDGCNAYAANGSTVTEDSKIKVFIDNQILPYINNSLTSNGGTDVKSIRLITNDEICNIINAVNSSNNCAPAATIGKLKEMYADVPEWLYSTFYWTMTPYALNSFVVYNVEANSILEGQRVYGSGYAGARPVITTLKSNIQ